MLKRTYSLWTSDVTFNRTPERNLTEGRSKMAIFFTLHLEHASVAPHLRANICCAPEAVCRVISRYYRLNKSRFVNRSVRATAVSYKCLLTMTRAQSTRQKVPERPMPALQWMTGGPTVGSSTPDSRTRFKNCRKAIGEDGTPKSGHVV